jgi:predicted TIM-barrel fold metal-dependent hydrolase
VSTSPSQSVRSLTLPSTSNLQLSTVRVVDADLHHQIASWYDVAPYMPEGMRHRVRSPGGPPFGNHGYRKVADGFGGAPIPPADGPGSRHPATDPRWVKEAYLEPRGVDRAILTGQLFHLGVQANPDLSAAVARGVNDWTLATWVRPFDCYKGSILIAQQDPAQAVAEIDRLGQDPGMVQVLMSSASEAPLGRRSYHPIYAACVRHGLPLALHLGGEGAELAPAASAAGHPSTYVEWYADLPQSYMAHLVSMVTDGVFERFPSLKVVLYEAGIFWLPHLLWRLDKNWKGHRAETPWVVRPPSEYILRALSLTTYPLELVPDERRLHQVWEMLDADRLLLFSSNYPSWELGDPFEMLAPLPASARGRVMAENALALYGPRLLAPSRAGTAAAGPTRGARRGRAAHGPAEPHEE